MDSIHIQGGIALQGKVCIQGSKNAALPILAATLLTVEQSYIKNCPRIADVYAMVSLLRRLGCLVTWREDGLSVDSSQVGREAMGGEAVKGMRSSLCLLGALLGRCGEAVLEHPGGCVIGERPINLHLWALEQMGVTFSEEEGMIQARTAGLHGARIILPMPSVGATENIILAGVMAEDDTSIEGAAKEPEIAALCRYLQSCGAEIDGIGTDRLVIHGGNKLYGTEFAVPSDRIVAGTYLMACIGTDGGILLDDGGGHLHSIFRLPEGGGAADNTALSGISHGSAVCGADCVNRSGGAEHCGRKYFREPLPGGARAEPDGSLCGAAGRSYGGGTRRQTASGSRSGSQRASGRRRTGDSRADGTGGDKSHRLSVYLPRIREYLPGFQRVRSTDCKCIKAGEKSVSS